MKIVTPGERHSDAIIRKIAAESLGIPEFEKTADGECDCCPCPQGNCKCGCACPGHKQFAQASVKVASDCDCCPCPQGNCKCGCACPGHTPEVKSASACPECGAAMQVSGNMERCPCGYAQATKRSAKSAKDTSIMEYYRKLYPDDYAKQLWADSKVTPPAGKPVEYGCKPVELVAAKAGECHVPDAHPESGVSAGSGAEKNPEPKWQKGDSANSVSGPEKAKSHGPGLKSPLDIKVPDVRHAASSTHEDLDLSLGANSVSGPERAKSHGAGLTNPRDVEVPDLKNADRLIPREVIARFCPECAQEMARRGIKAVKASFIAKQIAARAEEQGFKAREAVSPPGRKYEVEHLKKYKDKIDNPWALSWWKKQKGHKPHTPAAHK